MLRSFISHRAHRELRGFILKIFHLAVQIPLLIATLDRLTLVVLPLSFYQGQRNLDFSAFKIKPQGNQGVAFFIDFAVKPLDFMFVQKQFARP